MRREYAIAVLVAFGLVAPAAANAAPAPPSPPSVSAPVDGLKSAFEALPEPDRRALQDSLLWTGDYVGVVNGAFGPRTRDALTTFARRSGIAPEVVLTPKLRARALAAATTIRADVGFVAVKDRQAGVAVSLPLKLLPRRVSTDGGTHYASVDGAFVVDTLSRPAGPGGLAEVFDRMSNGSGTRKVTYKLLKPEFFVVSGDIADRKFYSRFVSGTVDGLPTLRGITLAYPKTDAARLDAVALASAASFEAFPSSATLPASPPSATAPPSAAASPPPAPKPPATFALNGIRVDPASALTHLPGQACLAPSIGGMPIGLLKQDPSSGLALFGVPATPGPTPVLVADTVASGALLQVLFNREPEGLVIAPAEVRSELSAGGFIVTAGVQGRAEGAPLVDRQGRLAGLALDADHIAPSIAGIRLQNDYPVVGSERLRSFLDQAGISTSQTAGAHSPKTLAAVAALWRPRLIRIVCQTAPAP